MEWLATGYVRVEAVYQITDLGAAGVETHIDVFVPGRVVERVGHFQENDLVVVPGFELLDRRRPGGVEPLLELVCDLSFTSAKWV